MIFQLLLHTNVCGVQIWPSHKKSKVNLRSSFEQIWYSLSPRCCIPRFSLKAFFVLEKKILSVFIIYGHGGHLIQWHWTIWTNCQYWLKIGPAVSEKKTFKSYTIIYSTCTNFHFSLSRSHMMVKENWPNGFSGKVIQRCGRTADGWQTASDHTTSSWAFGSGELKKSWYFSYLSTKTNVVGAH